MRKKRYLPSLFMIIGIILLILRGIAIPSAIEDSRFIVIVFDLVCVGLIVTGIILSLKKRNPLGITKE